MSDYWLSTKSPLNMYRSSYETAARDAYLIDNQGIDAALLATDLQMNESHVIAYQRKLGLREVAKRQSDGKWGRARK